MWRRVRIVAVGLVVAIVALVGVILADSGLAAHQSRSDQRERLAAHRAEVEALGGVVPDWRETGIVDDALPLNALRVIATHNSYATAPTPIQNAVIALVSPRDRGGLQYSHQPLWDQLELGIRSFELDVRAHRDGSLSLTHVPLVANGGVAVDFPLALEELALWSGAHPGHVPITVLLEFKSDYAFLDPTLRDWDAQTVGLVDNAVRDHLGDRLLEPSELCSAGGACAPAKVRADWPALGAVRGKILIVMHPGAGLGELYAQRAPSERAMFRGAYATGSEADLAESLFIIHDDPDVATITRLIKQGYIVRTRADADLETDLAERDQALASGAQWISTDFPAPLSQAGTGYTVSFNGGQLVHAGT